MATCLVSRSSQRRCHGNQSSASRRDNFSNRNQSKNCFFFTFSSKWVHQSVSFYFFSHKTNKNPNQRSLTAIFCDSCEREIGPRRFSFEPKVRRILASRIFLFFLGGFSFFGYWVGFAFHYIFDIPSALTRNRTADSRFSGEKKMATMAEEIGGNQKKRKRRRVFCLFFLRKLRKNRTVFLCVC